MIPVKSTLVGCTSFFCLRRLGVPFIGTRGLGAVGIPFGRQNFLSVGWRTGQSGAPPNTVRCLISFHKWRSRPLLSWSRWRTGHCPVPHVTVGSATRHARIARPTVGPADRWLTGQSGAHRTVRCLLLAVGLATCPAQIARPTVGPADRWLTGQSGEL